MRNENTESEIKYSHLLQVLCLILFYVVWTLDSFLFNVSTFLAKFVPIFIRAVTSLSVIIGGSILIAKAHRQLFKDKQADLITDGIFAHVRHPMYLGTILIYLGWIIGTLSLLTLIPWILILILYVKMANYEEKQLERKFGEKYIAYKKEYQNGYQNLK